jgi:hypothetical protein
MGLLLTTRGPQHGAGTTLAPYSRKQKMILLCIIVFRQHKESPFVIEGL